MPKLLAFLYVWAVVSPSIAGDTPPLKITTKRDTDRVEVKFEEDKATVAVRCPFEIGNAVIERTRDNWIDFYRN